MEIMKTLILFSSKYDTTRDCAVELKNYLSGQVDLVNVKKDVYKRQEIWR